VEYELISKLSTRSDSFLRESHPELFHFEPHHRVPTGRPQPSILSAAGEMPCRGTNNNENSEGKNTMGGKIKRAATLVMLQPATPARELPTWIHVPSQPLMRSLLSQFQTPAAPRSVRRFFRVWSPCGSLHRVDHPAYFGSAT